MRNVCTIDPKWLVDVAPNFFEVSKFSNAKRKSEKLQPLQPKYGQDPNAWRLSKRRAAALSSTH
jgi:ATP-dependent RNA helicase DHX8/PRP22